MGDGGGQFAQGSHACNVCEFCLCFAQSLFGVICADRRRNIGAGAPIAEKISLCVVKWLAAGSDVHWRSTAIYGVDEIAKWLMGVDQRPKRPPFLGFRFDISCNVPARHAGQT